MRRAFAASFGVTEAGETHVAMVAVPSSTLATQAGPQAPGWAQAFSTVAAAVGDTFEPPLPQGGGVAPLAADVLARFAVHGAPFLRALRGHFALVFFDGTELFAARGPEGPFGQLFWGVRAAAGGEVWFATDRTVLEIADGVENIAAFPARHFCRGTPGHRLEGPAAFGEPSVTRALMPCPASYRLFTARHAVRHALSRRLRGLVPTDVAYLVSGSPESVLLARLGHAIRTLCAGPRGDVAGRRHAAAREAARMRARHVDLAVVDAEHMDRATLWDAIGRTLKSEGLFVAVAGFRQVVEGLFWPAWTPARAAAILARHGVVLRCPYLDPTCVDALDEVEADSVLLAAVAMGL